MNATLSLRRFAIVAVLAALLSAGLVTTAPAKAEAVTGSCSNGRCIVKLSNAETRSLGDGRAVSIPAWVPGPLRIALSVSMAVHRWIARSYAQRGLCSAFVLDVRPWATQGYAAARC